MLLRRLPLVPLLGLLVLGIAVRTGMIPEPAPAVEAAPAPAPAAHGAAPAPAEPLRVGAVHVVLDPDDPRRARAVTFDVVAGVPGRLAIRIGGQTATCRLVGAHASCALVPTVPIATLDVLEVTAA